MGVIQGDFIRKLQWHTARSVYITAYLLIETAQRMCNKIATSLNNKAMNLVKHLFIQQQEVHSFHSNVLQCNSGNDK